MSDKIEERSGRLLYRANESPGWLIAIIYGLQQMMCCITGLLVTPFLVSNLMCAGTETIALRAKLISTTFVVSGIATFFQTTFGLRLAVGQGPSYSFLPPLIAFAGLPSNKCNASSFDVVPEEEWTAKMRTAQGSLIVASLFIIFLGAAGLFGQLAKLVGPVTVCPMLILLTISALKLALENISKHWVSMIQISVTLAFLLYLSDRKLPAPFFNSTRRRIVIGRTTAYGHFPYLISISILWIFCMILSVSGLEPEGGAARIDQEQKIFVLRNSPTFYIPYPGQFGMPQFNVGLCFGFMASCTVCATEALGSYEIIARTSNERSAPSSAVNRGILIEGMSCCLAGLMGTGTGVTTYSENVALISVTKVASRLTMQIAGVLMIIFGLFTKVGAAFATIPDPCIGAIVLVGMGMISGAGLSTLQAVDLKLPRNSTIIGFSILVGLLVPQYFADRAIRTGFDTLDEILTMLVNVPMLIGAFVAFALDSTVGGATAEQRGLKCTKTSECTDSFDGYSFPAVVNRFLLAHPKISMLPFMPSLKTLESAMSGNADDKK